jgi:hypothetical protein
MVAGRSIRIGVGLAPHRGTPRFTPGSLFANAGTGGWYDFCDLTTLYQSGTRASPGAAVTADGDPVGLVLDKSGNNNDLVQATSTKRPLYKTSGGISWLLFDGVDDYLSSAAAFNLSAYGQIALATAITPSTTATVLVAELGPNTSSTGGTFFIAVNNTAVGALDIAINGAGIDDNGTTSTAYGSGVTSEFSCQKLDITDGSAATRAPLRVNGASAPSTVAADAGTAGTTFSGTQTLYVGARAGTSLFFAGKMHGLFIRGNGLGADEINNLDTWMIAKTVAVAVSNEISGTSALTFAPSATATGLGTLGGSSALTFVDSATLTGLGTLAGSSALTFTDSGTLTGLGSLAGSAALTFSPSGTATGLGSLAGTSILIFAPSATATGFGALTGSATLVLTPSGTVTGLGSLIGASAVTFTPAGAITGTGTLAGATALTFAGSGTATGLGSLAGVSSLALVSSGTLTGLGALLGSTSLSWGLSGTVGIASSNDIAGSASLSFVSSGALSGLGQMAGSTAFSLTISGHLVPPSFIPTPRPAPANLNTSAPPSETNVIGPPSPSKVAVTTVSAASGSFVPSAKPPRVQWRT